MIISPHQETMLTPRSRKPVVALSGTNLCTLANFQSPLHLPATNDDLLTATVDLSFTHDSLSDSMIKSLEEDEERIFPSGTPCPTGGADTVDGIGNQINPFSNARKDTVESRELDLNSKAEMFTATQDMEKGVAIDECENREEEVENRYTGVQEPWDGGVSSGKLENRVTSSSSLKQDNSSPPFILSRVKKSKTNLFSRKTSVLELDAENQNQIRAKQSATSLAARYQNSLHGRDNFEINNQISDSLLRKEISLGSGLENRISNSLLKKENSVGAGLLENRPESGFSIGKSGDTPPSRKRSSQNNNNDEGEIKRCLRQSSEVFPLSETAL